MTYLVKVMQRDASIASLLIDAEDSEVATHRASADGHVVLSVIKQRGLSARNVRKQKFSSLLFSQELLALLNAGLSLVEALDALKNKRHYQSGGVVEGMAKLLSEGNPLSVAVARYPQHFSQLYVASVQASERTGNLPDALQRLVEYQEQMEKIRKKIVSASLYPAVLGAVGVIVLLFLLLYVVPRFAKVYDSFSGKLPFFSKLLIGLGNAVSDNGLAIGIGVFAALGASIAIMRLPATRLRISALLRRIPVLADNARLYELTRLYRTLGMLLRGGVPITRALTMATPMLGPLGRSNLHSATKFISEGRSISSALLATSMTTPVAHRMLLVGERTGSMGPMMERIAAFHEEDLTRWIEEFSKLFEPLLMLLLGLMVGGIVVVMYMPIFELATAIQ